MCPSEETFGPTQSEDEQETRALERYYERRLVEIRRHEPLDEDKLIPLERLRELADGSSSGGRAARSG